MRPTKCSHCSAIHEVDEILLGPEGTPIKCSSCQQVFKAFPEPEDILDSPFVWLLRNKEGQTIGFNRLGTLQKMIMDGEVKGDEDLSRYGMSWRCLHEIKNLDIFFKRRQK